MPQDNVKRRKNVDTSIATCFETFSKIYSFGIVDNALQANETSVKEDNYKISEQEASLSKELFIPANASAVLKKQAKGAIENIQKLRNSVFSKFNLINLLPEGSLKNHADLALDMYY